ncbi:hypothetical protein [Pseudomonas sp. LB3P38]|uniref:hypothetical protein n=1 Tax=Pseudomonas lyxosi TaxID=3398358 RepID=UPI0039F01A11
MKLTKAERIPSHVAWVIVLLGWGIEPAMGVSMDINALFRPDPSKPMDNKFINQTPSSGYCLSNPVECQRLNMFSIRLPLGFESTRPMQPDDNPRANAMFNVPAQWRALSVRNADTGESEQVEVRIAGIGSQYVLSDTAVNLTGAPDTLRGHQTLWKNSSWVYAPPPCEYSGVGYFSDDNYSFFWRTPVEGACVKGVNFPIPAMSYTYLDFAYELRTPNPLGMSSGLYTGNLSYRVGPGADFDMGDVMVPNDSEIFLSFVLEVQHTLKVDIPPGGNRIELVPQGGWQSWLQNGRKPTGLFRDQTFTISVSSRFKMNLECQYSRDGQTCSVLDPVSGHTVPLNVGVSLPHGLTDAAGQPVNRRQLLRDGNGTQLFQPGIYVDSKPGTLHFEVPASEVAEMIQPGQQRQYSGDVTVIWDSEV